MKFKKDKNYKSKRIAIDGYEANVLQRLGSSQVGFELLKNIERLDSINEYTVYLPTKPLPDLPGEREGWRYKILRPKRLWTRIALPFELYTSKDKPALIFSPTHYIPRFSPVKRVVTIFDLSYLHFPEFFEKKDLWQLRNWSKFSIENADHIVTISNFSKKDIIKNYKVDSKNITVAYPGYGERLYKPIKDFSKIEQVKQRYNIDGKYIVFVGTVQPRKNLSRVIEAVKKIENIKLVIIGKTTGEGKQGWMFDEILSLPKKLGIEDRVIFTGFMPDEDIPYIFNGAQAFVFTSLWEGFGIPAVDAMACGLPVIAADNSSLPEVVKDAGLLVNPYSIDQIEQAIRIVVSDKRVREKLSKKSLIQAKKFSWAKMAKQVIKVFENT